MPGVTLSITESMVLQALGDFITTILPAGFQVVQGQDNKVPEPSNNGFPDGTDYAIMWPTLRERIETNTDDYADITMEGSASAGVLTLTSVDVAGKPVTGGVLAAGQSVFGVGLTSGSLLGAQASGTPGGPGTYAITPSQSFGAQALAAGLKESLSPMKLTVQVDVHGPNSTDYAQIIVTLFRDDYACVFFAENEPPLAPLYIDNGQQIPFVSGEKQYEDRWVLEAKLQLNPVVSTPMQFADTLSVGLKEIDSTYPPGG